MLRQRNILSFMLLALDDEEVVGEDDDGSLSEALSARSSDAIFFGSCPMGGYFCRSHLHQHGDRDAHQESRREEDHARLCA